MVDQSRPSESDPGRSDTGSEKAEPGKTGLQPPAISLPKGGGAIKGIGEKFAANPVTGTGSLTIPISVSPGRGGFSPQLTLTYDSGAGNGPFGMGWSLGLPAITRKTDKGLPQYDDAAESDVFILSGAEDLVPVLVAQNGDWVPEDLPTRIVGGVRYRVQRYRPRVEGLFARIERWTNRTDAADVFWRSISRDNVTTWYGRTAESRIADPADPTHIFSWLICASYDDKGNVIGYDYKSENDEQVDTGKPNERNRIRNANRYPKRIRYGNHTPHFSTLDPVAAWPALPAEDQWYFELAFDYGEHDRANPLPQDAPGWGDRPDPFSSYRSGFEVRTYRLCRRALMFHHFPDEPELGVGCLVRSTDFTYAHDADPTNARNPIYSLLTAVTQQGYRRRNGGYRSRSLPPVEFAYSEAKIDSRLRELDPDSREGLPSGLGDAYQWIDLDGEGLSGILTEQGDGWFYKRNSSPINSVGHNGDTHLAARFAPPELIMPKPAFSMAAGARFIDLAGDGRPDAVRFDGPDPGFYERAEDDEWTPFALFRELPNRDWDDPNLRFVDLDGDGRSDVLITAGDVIIWHPSLGEDGFGPERRVPVPWDENHGPAVIFADSEHTVQLADMSGDGLSDLVRIRNGEVCYWPNLGYGRFGAKVTMDRAPWFDRPDQFDSRRLLLADIDGSGTTDLIYLHAHGIRVYFNQSGNGWENPVALNVLPPTGAPVDVQALDLLGDGTACLVWSSPLLGDTGSPLRYLDLMGGRKPHLLVGMNNNLGGETEIQYAPSTKFYLRDKLAGTPWATKLPFPVHVVERVTVRDRWRNTSFTSTYSYHHGYFDGPEREFRGFGRVEQVDVEDFGTFADANAESPFITQDHRLYQPPVKTVSWYHTGALIDAGRVLHQFGDEYFAHRLDNARQARTPFYERALPEPEFEAIDLTADERREALRACRGVPLRQEVYELDFRALAQGQQNPVRLVSATTRGCGIRLVQLRKTNQHAVFHVTDAETISYHYELDLRAATVTADPRITHTLNLRTDEYGNVLQSVTVGYPRWSPVPLNDQLLPEGAETLIAAVQGELHIGYLEQHYTDDAVAEADRYRLRLPCETTTYELTGIEPVGPYFGLDQLRGLQLSDRYPVVGGIAVEAIPYQQLPVHTRPQRRQVEQTRSLFFDDALVGPLPLGTINARALPFETYTLAMTDSLLTAVLGDRLTPDVTDVLENTAASGYLSGPTLTQRLGPDTIGQHWRCSGIAGFRDDARRHFFLPERYTDPFGNTTLLDYDPLDLYLNSSTDPLGNRVEVTEFDFRVLAPRTIRDINDNLSQVRYDILGMPTATASHGKAGEGENLDGFDSDTVDPDPADLVAFFVIDDYDATRAEQLLGGATGRYLYYFGETRRDGAIVWGQHPPCAAGIIRELHQSQHPDSPVQTAFEYSDSSGNIVVRKIQAEPESPGGAMRWVSNGKTILNNKGKPVKQYEPYFSPPEVGHRFAEPVEIGVTPVFFYDAAGRRIRTESPDGSVSRIEFSPWHTADFDFNDTVLEPGNAWYARMSTSADDAERRAAQLAAAHAGTSALTLVDSLGRAVVNIAHNRTSGTDEKHVTFTKLDAEGNALWVQDARGNLVMQYVTPPLPSGPNPLDAPQNLTPHGFAPCYDIAGQLLFQHGMDVGDRWTLLDATGGTLFAWNGRGFRSRSTYDALRRPLGVFVRAAGHSSLVGAPRDPALPPDPEALVEWRVYGESHPDAGTNLRGRTFRVYDDAGVATNEGYDFKGNLLAGNRRFARDYRSAPDWSDVADSADLDDSAADHLLEPGPALVVRTEYDALNRPTAVITPDGSVYRPSFNEANLLDRVTVNLAGAEMVTHFVTNIDYNAKGQRVRIDLGNGAATDYDYDPFTFRLTRLRTTRPTSDDATASMLFRTASVVQDLHYTYDPVGNITRIADLALRSTVQASAASDYVYDARYRLVVAGGREHSGQTEFAPTPNIAGYRDYPFVGARVHPNDLQGLRDYVEQFRYDAVGNIMHLVHHAGGDVDSPGQTLWQRRYQYALDSNRLLATSLPGDPDGLPDYAARGGYRSGYTYDAHGNIASMTHLPVMRWNHRDQLSATAQQVVNTGTPETTYYVYDANGQRARKVTETRTGVPRKERLYLAGFEIYQEFSGGEVALRRETLHVMDDQNRIAIVESATKPSGAPRIRYQLASHLGSPGVELDQSGALISYEDYHPYGTSAFQAGRGTAETSLKRYRYTGKERDEETGFNYHGARYYAPWLGRWTAGDPIFLGDGTNLYRYATDNPVRTIDLSGTQGNDVTATVDSEFVYEETGPGYKSVRLPSEEYNIPHYTFDPLEITAPAKATPPVSAKRAEAQHKAESTETKAETPEAKTEEATPKKSLLEEIKESETVQGLGGFLVGAGLAQVPFIGPIIGPAAAAAGVVDKPTKTFEFGYGAGQFAAGVVQIVAAIGMAGGGTAGAIGGAVAAPVSGGLSLGLSLAGVAAVAASAAVAAQGVANAGAGLAIMMHSGGPSSPAPGNPQLAPGGNASSGTKGKVGEEAQQFLAENEKDVVIGEQVTLESVQYPGKRIRIDLVAITESGELVGYEVKFGEFAQLTRNQRLVIPPGGGVVRVIPRGARAVEAGLQEGVPVDIRIDVRRYSWSLN
ncbi:SpvB/TcaC N-terminal domain-containing protein [Nocardia nepalensis]|uniref:SpvB/TcaC N-terminal domain-containing protein n=1 Tax=Nocardia nepalensis TaxID=3375448 RepID=UPI003B66C167